MYKVLWLTYVASPYKKKLFTELNKSIDLTVLLVDKEEENRNKEWVFEDTSFKTFRLNDNNYKDVINNQAEKNEVLIDSMYATKYGRYATKTFNKNNKISIMHADGGIAKNRGLFINLVMSHLMKKHNYFLSSSIYTDKYYNYYGIKDNIYHYRFTSLTKEDMCRHYEMFNHKELYKKKLGINKYTILSVGQPIHRKGYDLLVRAIKDIKDINFIVIGGGPLKGVSNYITNNEIDNIQFLELMSSKELENYYAACDAFILPTREDIWGLVVNEALSFGLPVITSDNCIAGLHFKDICTIVDNENITGYKQAIINTKIQGKDCSKTFSVIRHYTIEESAEDIYNVIRQIANLMDCK